MSIRITGIGQVIAGLSGDWERKRERVKRAVHAVTEDLLRTARGNAPVQTGALIESGSANVIDRGRGRGFLGTVGFDTPYALRMHEGHYQAHDPHDRGVDRAEQTLRFRKGGFTVKQRVAKRTADGFWIDSRGRKRGRKYLQRAVDEKRAAYEMKLREAGEG